MVNSNRKDWKALARKAANEQDPKKLLSPSLKNSIKLWKNAKTSFAAGCQKELPQKERAATSFSWWMMNRAFV